MTTYIVSSGVPSSDITLHSGDVLEVMSGGSAVNITVNSGGTEFVFAGGTAVSTTVNYSGGQQVSAGGKASFTSVTSGGTEFVFAGGTAVSTTLTNDGNEQVYSGGRASFTSADDGGAVVVFHGGSAVGTTLTNVAFELVSSGGAAVSTTVSSGSYLWVSSGGTASFVAVSSGGSANVSAGGSVRFATVDNGGTETVSGTAISTTVNSGGFEDVSSGGRTSFTTVDSGGTENVFAGGTAVSVTVTSNGSAFVYPGGTTSFATVNDGASEYVYEGGHTVSTSVKSGGTEFVFPGGTASFTAVSSGGALDEPAASGSAGLVIDVVYDSTVAEAPPGFKTTVAAAVDYLESLISTPITITIDVGFGEVGGMPLASTDLGESESSGIDVSYQTLRSALLTHAAATGDYAAAASLPPSDPTDGGTFYVSYAEAEALGLSSGPGAGGTVGAIGLSSSLVFTYGTTDAATPDTYDAFGVVEHEITEVMGRTEDLGEFGTGLYTPLDLFRYASPGERDLTPTSGWFSVDGTDLLAQFNDPFYGGDAGDWATSVPNDSFDAFSLEGAVNPVSPTDLQVMDAIGYTPTVIEPAAVGSATWLGAVSADWDTASDWNIGVVPDIGTIDVLISQPGIYVVSIAAGERVTVGAVTLADASNASGALAISGTGTSLTALGEMEVGAGGAGSLLIENQATAVTGGNTIALGFDVGTEAGASGAVTVTGTHSLLLNTGEFIVGDGGLGSLSIEDGGTVVTGLGSAGGPAAVIANGTGAAGSAVNVTGAGADWRVAGTLVVGNSAQGGLDIAAGATVTATSLIAAAQSGGDGVITVAGTNSLLQLTGSVTLGAQGAGELAILSGATASALDLTIGGTPALSSGNVDVEGAGSELSIGTGGALNIGVADGGSGVLTIGSAAVLNFAGIPVESGHASFNNYGTVDPDGFEYTTASNGNAGLNLYDLYIGNIGAVQVSAGTSTWFTPMVLTGTSVADAANNIGNNGDVGEWQLSNGGTLVFNANTVDAGQAIVFEDATDTLVIGQQVDGGQPGVSGETPTVSPGAANLLAAGGFAAELWGYQAGDQILFDNLVVNSDSIVGGNTLELFGAGGTLLGELTFYNKAGTRPLGSSGMAAAAAQLECFAAGTRLLTARGEVAVEAIAVGERVRVLLGDAGDGRAGDGVGGDGRAGDGRMGDGRTGDGLGDGGLRDGGLAMVVWVGRREVDCARHPQPRKVWPVRVAAGAFGAGRPHTDLWLSPDHAVYVEEVLIPVKYLINGSTIVQVPVDSVTYHHIELAQHDVLLAEGLPVESFLHIKDGRNYPDRAGAIRLYPDYTARMWEAFGCARLVVTGPELQAARALVAEVAGVREAA